MQTKGETHGEGSPAQSRRFIIATVRRRWIAAALVVAVAAVAAIVAVKREGVAARSDSTAAPTNSSGMVRIGVTRPVINSSSKTRRTDTMRNKTLAQSVAEAQVIVVGTALDSAPAPPKVRGDLLENAMRFRVARVLKGNFADQVITARTPTDPDDFIDKEWILMLSPAFVAGRHSYADCYAIKFESEVKTVLSNPGK